MTLVHFPQAQAAHPTAHVPPVGAAVEAFFVHRDLAPNSRRVYRAALDPLVAAVGAGQPLAALTPRSRSWGCSPIGGVVLRRRRGTLGGRRCGRSCPGAKTGGRSAQTPSPASVPAASTPDHTRAIPYRDLDELWRRRSVPLREKTLWRMLYETAARASEVLALDVGDLDRPQRRARVVSKGGNTDMVYWATPTARLLARYLAGRGGGPLFLTTGPLPPAHLPP